MTGVGDSLVSEPVAASVGVTVCVGLGEGLGAGMVMRGLRLPQAYDDSEQHEQIMQAIKKVIA